MRNIRPFILTKAKILIGATGAVLFGIGFIFAASQFYGAPNAVLGALGGGLISLGAITFMSDYYFKPVFMREIVDIVELKHRLYAAGVKDFTLPNQFDWNAFYSRGNILRVLLHSPEPWISRDWPTVLDQAKQRELAIEIYLIETDNSASATAGESENTQGDTKTVDRLEQAWTRARSSTQGALSLHASSSLTLQGVQADAAYSIIQNENAVVLILPSPVVSTTSLQPGLLHFSFEQMRGFPGTWIEEIWEDVVHSVAKPPLWTDKQVQSTRDLGQER